LSPVMAGLVHILHTLGILANSSRLLFFEIPETGGLAKKRRHKPDGPAEKTDPDKRESRPAERDPMKKTSN